MQRMSLVQPGVKPNKVELGLTLLTLFLLVACRVPGTIHFDPPLLTSSLASIEGFAVFKGLAFFLLLIALIVDLWAQATTSYRELESLRMLVLGGVTSNEREPIPDWLRSYIIQRDGQRCQYCGSQGNRRVGPDGQPWHIDHVVPVQRGGPTLALNLTLACQRCNVRKGHRPVYVFVRALVREGIRKGARP